MKKWKAIAVTFIIVMALTIPLVASSAVLANTAGLTPGYWKNHVGAWEASGISPCTMFYEVIEARTGIDVTGVFPGDVTMAEAIQAKGNKNGWNALYRHLAAALLNKAHPGVPDYLSTPNITQLVQDIIDDVNNVESVKNEFAGFNSVGNAYLGPGLQGKVHCP